MEGPIHRGERQALPMAHLIAHPSRLSAGDPTPPRQRTPSSPLLTYEIVGAGASIATNVLCGTYLA